MSSSHINAPIRAHMYANTRHKVIWVAAVVVSAGLLAPPLFFVAAKKRVVSMTVPAIYAAIIYGSAIAETDLVIRRTGQGESSPSR